MRYAIHKINETSIFQIMEVSEYLVDQVIPAECIAIPVGVEISDATHIIVDGKPVLKPQE